MEQINTFEDLKALKELAEYAGIGEYEPSAEEILLYLNEY